MKKIFFISILVLSFSKINAQESDDFMYMNAFIIVADTSESYEILHKKMYELSSKLNFEVDTMGRGYDKNKGLICLPENHEDEIYAGDYFPRRYPSDKLSLEYLDYYKKGNKPSGGIIALVIAITDKKEHAESILKKVQTQEKNAFILESKIYMGCMH